MWGDLRIQAGQPGKASVVDGGEFTTYYWNPLWNVTFIIPWILLLVVALHGRNRIERGWTVLLPFLALQVPLSALDCINGFVNATFPPGFLVDMCSMVNLGFAAVWAYSHAMQGRTRFGAFLVAGYSFAVASLLTAASITGVEPFMTFIMTIMGTVLGMLALLALALAGYCCRRIYSPRRFVMWLLLWNVVIPAIVVVPLLLLMILPMMIGGVLQGGMLFGQLMLGLGLILVTAVLLSVFAFPYLLLTFRSECYRTRFHGIFRLPGMLPEYPGESPEPPDLTEFSEAEALEMVEPPEEVVEHETEDKHEFF